MTYRCGLCRAVSALAVLLAILAPTEVGARPGGGNTSSVSRSSSSSSRSSSSSSRSSSGSSRSPSSSNSGGSLKPAAIYTRGAGSSAAQDTSGRPVGVYIPRRGTNTTIVAAPGYVASPGDDDTGDTLVLYAPLLVYDEWGTALGSFPVLYHESTDWVLIILISAVVGLCVGLLSTFALLLYSSRSD